MQRPLSHAALWLAVLATAIGIFFLILSISVRSADIPKELKQQIVATYLASADGQKCAIYHYAECSAEQLTRDLMGTGIDLNDDGMNEFMVEGITSPVWCGNHSCARWIFRQSADGYEEIGIDGGRMQHGISNGYHDLLSEFEIVEGVDMKILWRFDGARYQEEKCWQSKDGGEFIAVSCHT